MTLFLTTTGTQSLIVLNDLAGLEIPHPTTDFEISAQFENDEINNSQDLKDALDNGYITLKDENDNNIVELLNNNSMQKITYDKDNDDIVDNSNALEGNSKAYILNRSNHTGSQPASTISDFDTKVENNRTVSDNKTHRLTTTGNPHSVTKNEVGLGNVDNTSDANKPISTLQQNALNLKIDTVPSSIENDISVFDNTGNIKDGGKNLAYYDNEINKINNKFDKGLSEPTGIPEDQLVNSNITYNNLTRTINLNVTTDTYYYIHGVKYDLSVGTYSATIDDVKGNWFIYLDGTSSLKKTQTVTQSLFKDNALVSIVYWNKTNQEFIIVEDERHGTIMNGETHTRLHSIIGAVVDKGTCATQIVTATGTGNLDTDVSIGFTPGKVWDEDRSFDINKRIGLTDDIPLFYIVNGEWHRFTDTTNHFPMIYGTAGCPDYSGTRLCYNNVGTPGSENLAEVTQGDFVVYLYFAMNENDETKRIAGIVGQRLYTTYSKAKNGIITELQNLFANGIPSNEFAFLSGVIFQTRSSYSNIPKARLREVDSGVAYLELRGTTKLTVSATNGLTAIPTQYVTLLEMRMSRFTTLSNEGDLFFVGNTSYDNTENALIFYGSGNSYSSLNSSFRTSNNRYSFKFRFGKNTGTNHENIYLRFGWAKAGNNNDRIFMEIHHIDNTHNTVLLRSQVNGNYDPDKDLGTQNFIGGTEYDCVIETFGKFVKIYIDGVLLSENGNTNGFSNANELAYEWGEMYIIVVSGGNADGDSYFYILDHLKIENRVGE